jgi:hypothetical protein
MSVQDEQWGDERSQEESQEGGRDEEHGGEHQTGPQPGEVANLPPPPLVPVGPSPHEAPDEERATEEADRDEQAP